MSALTALEIYERDLKTLADSINLDTVELGRPDLTREQEKAILDHRAKCLSESRKLRRLYDEAKAKAGPKR